MRTIALISQKGGVGKTTIAIHLASAFAASGRNTLLVDLDPQASASEWKDARASESPGVLAIPAARLPKVLEDAAGFGTEVVIIDTAPHSEGASLAAARAADLILVPCQPSIMDLRALRKTAELLAHIKKPTYAVLNSVSPHAAVYEGAARAIADSYNLAVADVRLGDRVAFNRCLIDGRTVQEYDPESKAAQELLALWEWASELVGLPAQHVEVA